MHFRFRHLGFIASIAMLAVSSQALAQSTLKQPLISANGLFLYQNSSLGNDQNSLARNGIDLQEAELAFYAEADPYSRFVVLMTVVPEYTLDNSAPGKVKETWDVEPEELYAESTQLPWVTMRLGKFKAFMGKQNTLHTHAFPFVDQSLANIYELGSDGLQDVGVSAAVMIPSSWYDELTLQYLGGKGTDTENTAFKADSPDDGIMLAHWKNLFDLSDATTMEIGGSAATGRNSTQSTTNLYGLDLTFKWRPVEGGRYHSAIFAAEYLGRDYGQPGASSPEKDQGLTVWGKYQFEERWATLLRFESLNVNNSVTNIASVPDGSTTRETASLTFAASEFSSYRIDLSTAHGPHNSMIGMFNNNDEKRVFLQANFTIGAHPAHQY